MKFTDVSADEITISSEWDSNLIISINGTDDKLIINGYKWGNDYTFEFADGTMGTVNRDTWTLETDTSEPALEMSEDELIQTGAESISTLYEDDAMAAEYLNDLEQTIISDVTDSSILDDDSDDISDMTDIQVMLLAENMSAFGNDDQVPDNMNINDITTDTSALDLLLVGSLQ